jgi:hypothetical protein
VFRVFFYKPADPSLAEARKACNILSQFEEGVRKNYRAQEVLRTLGDAERHGKLAAGIDAKWVPLVGGIQSIRIALNNDNPQAAQVGIAVTRTECKKTVEKR